MSKESGWKRYSLSGVAGEEGPPEHEEAGEGALRVPKDDALRLLPQSDPGQIGQLCNILITKIIQLID